MPDVELNPTAAALLGLLQEGPMSGWDLSRSAEQQLGNFWNLTQSQVYRELARLSEAGLVAAEQRGNRDRQPFRLTPEGELAFVTWLASGPGRESIRYPLLLTVAFGAHLDRGRLDELLAEQRSVHRQRLEDYRRRRADLEATDGSPYALGTLAFGIRHEEATLAWFDDLTELLRR